MTYQERQELNALSLKCFGTLRRWQKIVNNGVAEPFEKDRKVLVPDRKGRIEEKVFTDKKSVVKHYTTEEIRQLMLDILEKREALAKQMEQNNVEVSPAETENNKGD